MTSDAAASRARRPWGVAAPMATPFEADGAIALGLWAEHGAFLLEAGATDLAPFGTTGEALSLSTAERREALEALVLRGVEPARLTPGTGLCNLPETAALTRHAMALGCRAALTLPPFFYVKADEDGLFAYMARLIEAVGPAARLCLYHIPQLAGVGFSAGLTARLATAFPEQIVAYKDSGGDLAHTRAVMAAAPGVAMSPGSEIAMAELWSEGAAGCVSASVNVSAPHVRAVFDDLAAGAAGGDVEARRARMIAIRSTLEGGGFIQVVKAILAARAGEPRWLRARPPVALPSAEAARALYGSLVERLGADAFATPTSRSET